MKRKTVAITTLAIGFLLTVPAASAFLISTGNGRTVISFSDDFGAGAGHGKAAVTAGNAGVSAGKSQAEVRFGEGDKMDEKTITEIAVESNEGQFDVLIAALNETDLSNVLSSEKGDFTVFAPTDNAFHKFLDVESDEEAIETFKSLDSETQEAVLDYHITPGEFDKEEVLDSEKLVALSGQQRPTSQIADAGLVKTNIEAENGILHVIGGVLDPSKG